MGSLGPIRRGGLQVLRAIRPSATAGAIWIPGENSTTLDGANKLGVTPGLDRDEITGIKVDSATGGVVRVAYLAAYKCSVSGGIVRVSLRAGAAELVTPAVSVGTQIFSGINVSIAIAVGDENKYGQVRTTASPYIEMLKPLAATHTTYPAGIGMVFAEFTGLNGTYDFSVQFGTTAGTLFVKDRRLIVVSDRFDL